MLMRAEVHSSLAARCVRWAARQLQVEAIDVPGLWLWRLFIRPAPADPGRADRLLAMLLAALARALDIEQPHQPTHWLLRLFILKPRQADPAAPVRPRSRWLEAALRPVRALIRRAAARLPQVDRERLGARLEAAAEARWLQAPVLRIAALAVSGWLFWLVATTPLDWGGQVVFVLVLWWLAAQLRRLPGRVPTLVLIALSVLASTRYLWWRVTQSMDLETGWEMALGMGLLGAELYACLIMVLGFAQTAWPLERRPHALPPDVSRWPSVDVYIPTYNEPLSVLRPTVLAAKGIDWPPDRFRIYVLDDGRRQAVREFAEQAGVGYLTRPDNRHAKAGNLNHAMRVTDGEFVAIFDCDHLPVRSFLQTAMGWMMRDPRCAMIQTPHHFFSPDPFERNLDTYRRVPNEGALFYGIVQDGNDFWNATFFCGSCAVLRRDALAEIGGVAVETVTEDAHTALKLQRRGWRTAYMNLTQAAGLATETLASHVGQRVRWARGMAQIFRIDNPLFGRGLSLMQRLCYSNSMLHFFYGIPRLVFLTAPLSYLFFQFHVIRAEALLIALYALPHLALPNIANARIQGPHRHTFWSEIYETVLAWYIVLPTTFAFINPRYGRFNVTGKGGLTERTHVDWHIARPYLLLMVLNGAAFAVGIIRLLVWNRFEAGTVVLNLFWTVFNLLLLGAALGVAREQRQVRIAHRVDVQLEAGLLLPDGHTQRCHTVDYSLHGLGLQLAEPLTLAPGDPLQVLLHAGRQQYVFPATVVALRDLRLGVAFAGLTLDQEQALIQCTFARADAWTYWHEQYDSDHPLQGLKEIALLGVAGYRGLLRSLTLPLRNRLAAWREPELDYQTALERGVPLGHD